MATEYILVNVPCSLKKNGIFYKGQLVKLADSFSNFLSTCSTNYCESVLDFATITALVYFFLKSVFCFMYFEALLLSK